MNKASRSYGIVSNIIFLIFSVFILFISLAEGGSNVMKWSFKLVFIFLGIFFSSLTGLLLFVQLKKYPKSKSIKKVIAEDILDSRIDEDDVENKKEFRALPYWGILSGLGQVALGIFPLCIINPSNLFSNNQVTISIIFLTIVFAIIISGINICYHSIIRI